MKHFIVILKNNISAFTDNPYCINAPKKKKKKKVMKIKIL